MSDQTFERAALDGKDREQLSAIAGALGIKSISRMRKAEIIDAILSRTGRTAGANGENGSHAAPAPAPVSVSAAVPANDTTAPRKAASVGAAEGHRTIRSQRASVAMADDLATLAAEEDALGTGAGREPDVIPMRPRRAAPAEPPASSGPPASTGTAPALSAVETVAPSAPNGSETASPTAASSAPRANETSGSRRNETSASGGNEASGSRGNETSASGGNEASAAATATATVTAPSPAGDGEGGFREGEGDANRRRRRRRGRDRDREPRAEEPAGEPVEVEGLLDLRDEGYGFLRATGYLPGRNDAYVSASQVRRFGLRKGDHVTGATRVAASNEKYPALMRVDAINGLSPDDARQRARFEDLTPLFPDSKLRLELLESPLDMTGRIVDLISPIGKGQRGLIVSPPKAGKTTIIKQIVHAIERNNPECHVIVLLVDERPEEVTDMRRHVVRAEVVASTFDRPSDEHCQVAELAIDRAKRLVELGNDVVIVLDGITRLARAYNLAAPASGRIMSGGVDSSALYPPKKFFGAARNIEEGGSLTILATALIETGSKMDEVIFEEFKGTGNMELRLDRRLADRRIYPAIDVEQSSTRHEELLFERGQLQQVWKLRRVLNALEGGAGLELLIDKIRTTKSNDEFLAEIAKAPAGVGT